KENVESALSEAKGILKSDSETKNVQEEIAGFRKALDHLLDKPGIEQLLVLITDLDRCLRDTAIEPLDATRLFVFTSRTGSVVPASVRTALGEKSTRAQNALMLSAQIGPILASGTKGNPRQIKRFLNTLLLRQSSAKARGFGDAVNLPVLAKLMLAERFLPRL